MPDARAAQKARYENERNQPLATFAATLKGLRTEQGYPTQEALTKDANLHLAYIGRLENGQCEPGLLTLMILSDTLRCLGYRPGRRNSTRPEFQELDAAVEEEQH